MKFPAYFSSLTARFLHRSQAEQDLEEELRSHLQHRADDLERFGLNRAEAERRARIEFGGRERFKEECHETFAGNFIETLARDARFALRKLRQSPSFTIAAILTLAMAIGANAIVFSVMNGMFLKPLNVPQAQSLYQIQRGRNRDPNQSYPDYLDLRNRNRSFADLAAYIVTQVALDTGGSPSQVWGVETSGNYFDALGIRPYLGRLFHASDEHGANSAPYVVLSYDYWHSQFHDDHGVIGRTVQLNKHPFVILGVAPPGFRGTLVFFSPRFFVPVVNREQVEGANDLDQRGTRALMGVVGHLKPGVTPAQATADLNSIASYLGKAYPKQDRNVSFSLGRPNLFGDQFGRPVQAFLGGLMLLAGLILLAACANLGSLFAARAADRSREVALRLALGASRGRIVRGLFTEAVLISLAGGGVGLWASVLFLRWLGAWQPFGNFPVHTPVNPDARVYGLALLLSLASGFLFGVVPLGQVLRTDPYELVKSGTKCTPGRRIGGRDLLLASQIAICAVLVTSSVVALRGLLRALNGHFGFEAHNSMLVTADLHMAGYSGKRVPLMQKKMINVVQRIPGVAAVGLSDYLLLNDATTSAVFTDRTTDLSAANAAADVYVYHISPEYLRAEGTTLVYGRPFTWHDDKNSPPVAVVNREFARKIFGSAEKAMGGYYKVSDGTRVQVVGIAEDGKYASLTEDPHPAMFLPILQWPSNSTWLVVRSGRGPQPLGTDIRNTLHELDPGLPVEIETRYDEMVTALFPSQIASVSLGVMGGMGAMLAITGIFGLAAYTVSKKKKELGIRIALGAQRKEVLQAALGRALKLLAFGSAAGLVLGILASRVLALVVFEATPRDPLVLAAVVLAMSLLGLLATWVPAQRALAIDPMMLLREE
ncbi:MAG TPA: ABC transporter permease [Terriglobales bacterium]|nr:ABC transporter permease [Terriglobales bacterium]